MKGEEERNEPDDIRRVTISEVFLMTFSSSCLNLFDDPIPSAVDIIAETMTRPYRIFTSNFTRQEPNVAVELCNGDRIDDGLDLWGVFEGLEDGESAASLLVPISSVLLGGAFVACSFSL